MLFIIGLYIFPYDCFAGLFTAALAKADTGLRKHRDGLHMNIAPITLLLTVSKIVAIHERSSFLGFADLVITICFKND